MSATACGALVLFAIPAFAPAVTVLPLLVQQPILEGVLTYIVVRRGLRAIDGVVSATAPPLVWLGIWALTVNVPDGVGQDHRTFVWVAYSAFVTVAAVTGAVVAGRKRCRQIGTVG
jgi:hypothetical protein